MIIDLKLSPETEALLEELKAVPLGGEITYFNLSARIGRPVDGPARGKLSSARRIALREFGIAFDCIRGVGLRRITADEAHGMGAAARSSIRSTARRTARGIRAVVAASNGISPEAQRQTSREIGALNLLAEVATEPVQAAFETDGPAMVPALAGAAFLRHIGIAEEDDRRNFFERVTGKRRLREMSPSEKDGIVAELRRLGFKPAGARRQLSGPFAKKLQALWITAWNLGLTRSREDGALLAFVRRQTGIENTRFLQDAHQAEKAIEALKGWIARDGGVDWSNEDKPSWLKKYPGGKIAVAQFAKLEPGWTGAEHFRRFNLAVAEITRAEQPLYTLSQADWQAVMNDFGARIRAAQKGVINAA